MAPLNTTVPAPNAPAPPIAPPRLKVALPPPKLNVPPEATVKAPGSLPPPVSASVPELAFTVPVLLNATPTEVVPVPPVFSKIPALLNIPGTPLC